MEDDGNNGWDLPPPHTNGGTVTDVAMPLSPLTNDGDDYDNKGGEQHGKSGGGQTTMTSNKSDRWMTQG